MENKWNNNEFNNTISSFYLDFRNDFKRLIGAYCGTKDFIISQIYPNVFQFSSFQIEFFLTEKVVNKNSIKIQFPKVSIHNDQLYFSDSSAYRDSDQKIFSLLLSENFDKEIFRFELNEIFYRFYHSYKLLIQNNFTEIRDNYFDDIGRKLSAHELKMFEKPDVLIRCEVSYKVNSYGYKAGEGRNYSHLYYVKYIDVHNYSDIYVQSYLKDLNLLNPKDSDKEYYEMNPSDYSHRLQFNYFDLDLSEKINRYVKLNRINDNKYDYKEIIHKPIVKIYDDNFSFFEALIIIYVISKFDLSSILKFFSEFEEFDNQSYQNLLLLSQYFLNRKYSNYIFIDGFNMLRNRIISELREKNFKGSKFNQICSAYENIGGCSNDLIKLKYFYVNYRNNSNYSDIDYDDLFFIIREYFKL